MRAGSQIEWTDVTWNPVTGCTKISPGCDHCYAERFAERWRGTPGHPYEQGFDLRLWPARLDQPGRWRRPRLIFVNSMSDLFHKKVPRPFIDQVFDVMEATPRHVFQVLTKRSTLMRAYVQGRYAGGRAPDHIWLGVSVEDRARRNRIVHLQEIEAAAFFFKQWGGLRPKSGGRLLAGKTWDEFPPHLAEDLRKHGLVKFKCVQCGQTHLSLVRHDLCEICGNKQIRIHPK